MTLVSVPYFSREANTPSGPKPIVSSSLNFGYAYSGSGATGLGSVALPIVVPSSSLFETSPSPFLPKADPKRNSDNSSYLPISEQISELQAALSLNKSQLAEIMRVTRPTLYDWFSGKAPNETNDERLAKLTDLLQKAGISSLQPLNARFVRLSLLELLSEKSIDEEKVLNAIDHIKEKGRTTLKRTLDREHKLRALGFEEPDSGQRRRQLATNVALQKWPEK